MCTQHAGLANTPFASSISTWACTVIPSSAGPSTISWLRSRPSCCGRRATTRGTPTVAHLSDPSITARSSKVPLRNTLSTIYSRPLIYQFKKILFTIIILSTIRRNVLENYRSDGMDDLGAIKWSLALCVFAVFVLVYFSLWKGVRSTGKVITFFLTSSLSLSLIRLTPV